MTRLAVILIIVFAFISSANAQAHTFYTAGEGKKLFTKKQVDTIVSRYQRQFPSAKVALKISGQQIKNDTLFIYYTTNIDFSESSDTNTKSPFEDFSFFIGKPLPPFNFSDVEGIAVNSKNLLGRPVVINFWFASCKPCIAEMPEMNRIKELYKQTDVVFLSMTFETEADTKAFLSKQGFTYQTIPGAREYIEQCTTLYPMTLFVNRKGVISHAMRGMPITSEIDGKHEVDNTKFITYLKQISSTE